MARQAAPQTLALLFVLHRPSKTQKGGCNDVEKDCVRISRIVRDVDDVGRGVSTSARSHACLARGLRKRRAPTVHRDEPDGLEGQGLRGSEIPPARQALPSSDRAGRVATLSARSNWQGQSPGRVWLCSEHAAPGDDAVSIEATLHTAGRSILCRICQLRKAPAIIRSHGGIFRRSLFRPAGLFR